MLYILLMSNPGPKKILSIALDSRRQEQFDAIKTVAALHGVCSNSAVIRMIIERFFNDKTFSDLRESVK